MNPRTHIILAIILSLPAGFQNLFYLRYDPMMGIAGIVGSFLGAYFIIWVFDKIYRRFKKPEPSPS